MIPLYAVENHVAIVSICSRCQQGTTLRLLTPSFPICFYCLTSTLTVLLFGSTPKVVEKVPEL